MKKAKLKTSFSMVQWFGDEYPYYEIDANDSLFKEDNEVLVLMEVEPNVFGKMYVIYCSEINESVVINEQFLTFLGGE